MNERTNAWYCELLRGGVGLSGSVCQPARPLWGARARVCVCVCACVCVCVRVCVCVCVCLCVSGVDEVLVYACMCSSSSLSVWAPPPPPPAGWLVGAEVQVPCAVAFVDCKHIRNGAADILSARIREVSK
eukprot:GHVU01182546.1.p2 GENE.GHVU01182546.1~~GHVU01182546.1.p2  ORF type:complete len:130 (-),score=18.39 GHVU01182546.1:233-622(-)